MSAEASSSPVNASTDHWWDLLPLVAADQSESLSVVAARSIPYDVGGNRLQTFNVYLPENTATQRLVGTKVTSLPRSIATGLPRSLVFLHGGAWRDPDLSAQSIEPSVAYAFSSAGDSPIDAIISINYTLSEFPAHPTKPYDHVSTELRDPAREAVHPKHIEDIYKALLFLRSLGLEDYSYVLAGHSCGACLAFQAALQSPNYYGLSQSSEIPCPAALFGLNGLYDLPALVTGLGPSHEHLRDDYKSLLSHAFGAEMGKWGMASPARFSSTEIANRMQQRKVPKLILLDQSQEDQLVPLNQLERLHSTLRQVHGLPVIRGSRCKGEHATPWQGGAMIWQTLLDVLAQLSTDGFQ